MSRRLLVIYEGQTNRVSAQSLLTSLLSLVALIEEVKSELPQYKDTKLNIYINRVENGSFIVELEAALSVIQHIKQIFGISDIKDLIIITLALIAIKKHLRGEPPSKVEEGKHDVTIYNINGDKLIVPIDAYKIATRSENIDRLIEESISPLTEEPNVKRVIIKTDDQKVGIDREEFEYLIEDDPLLEEDVQVVTKTNQVLVIVKIVFEPHRKWEFVYEGNKISAYIKDKDFFAKIDRGEKFSKGDKLLVDLEIKQVLDKNLGVYLNEGLYRD